MHAPRPSNVRLREALAHLATPGFSGIELNVDVKHTGCEAALLESLHHFDLLDRTVISSQVPAVLDHVRALEPHARVAISIGGRVARASRRWRDWRANVLAGLSARRWDALMAQHRLIDSDLLSDVIARESRLYAWTVNDRGVIDSLRSLGVHGVATADPRLFAVHVVPAAAALSV
jgi:glycerophosphoryl diester phosphodiesterase